MCLLTTPGAQAGVCISLAKWRQKNHVEAALSITGVKLCCLFQRGAHMGVSAWEQK